MKRPSRGGTRLLTLSGALLLLLGTPSWGETPTPTPGDNPADMSLGDLNKTEVVYTASKSEEKTTEEQGTTTIITSSEIKAGGFRTLDDLLTYVRGFYVTSDRDYTYLGLRGFGSLGGYNSRILLLIDGHRTNDDVYGEFYTGEDAMVDMDMIDHVEIIRGPASVLYGSNAVFGVINVVTKRAKDINGEVLTAQGGSLNTLGGGALSGGETDSGIQWAAEGSAYYSGGNENLYYPEYNSPSTNNGIAHDVDGEDAEHAFLSLRLEDWAFEGAIMHRVKTIPTGEYGTQFNDPNNWTDDLDGFAELNYRHGDPESGLLSGRLYADVSDYTGNYVASGTLIPNIDIGNGAWWGSQLQYVFEPFARNKFTVGGEFIDNFEEFQENYNQGQPLDLDSAEQSTEWALYAQDEIRLHPSLLLDVGGRYDSFSNTGGQLLPRGSLIWQPFSTSTVKLIGGEGFRAPSPYELYYEDGGISQDANPNLKNEVFETYEFDWEQSFLQEHRVILSLFRYVGDDLILGTQNPVDGLLIYENVSHISCNGVEVEYQFNNAGGIQGRLSWSYQQAVDDLTGQVLPDSPQDLGKASLQVPIDARHLTVSGECQFTGASYGYNGVWAPQYTLFNLKLYSPHFIWDNLEANLAAYNLLNTTYYQPVSNALLQQTLQQNGLVIWAHLGLRL